MTTATKSARTDFVSILGENHVVSDPEVCSALQVDGRVPKYVVYPKNADEAAQALRCASEHDLAVIPCRNCTKLAIGNPPARYDVALSLKQMNQVWHYEPADLTVSVEPGMKFGDFQDFVGRHGLWLPLDPAGNGRASLGGILATNSAGPLRLHYGSPRDMVLGMTIATTEGKLVKTGGRVVKNVAGYDLGKLLIGSYGTLGVIVGINLKLYTKPAERATFVFRLAALETARNLRRRILGSPLDPLRLALLSPVAAGFVRTGSVAGTPSSEMELWLEAAGSKNVIERFGRELDEIARQTGARIERLGNRVAGLGWSRVADFRSLLASESPELVAIKALLPISAVEDFLERAQQRCDREKLERAAFAQPGSGVVELALLGKAFESTAPLEQLRSTAVELGGVIIIESCPVKIKEQIDVWGAQGDDFSAMRKLKESWDPKGVLSPERFVGGL